MRAGLLLPKVRAGTNWLASLLLGLATLTCIAVAIEPLPDALEQNSATGMVLLDRHGARLGELRGAAGLLSEPLPAGQLPERVVEALLGAEDRRFFRHFGLDPLATSRAVGQALLAGRIVSGASTLSQQLARQLVPHERTLWGKWREAVLSLRLESSLSKDEILRLYLERVEFGPGVRGIAAASRRYLAKPFEQLSWSEAATLVAVARGPGVYDPARHPERVLRRRNRILQRLRDARRLDEPTYQRSLSEPLRYQSLPRAAAPQHFARAIFTRKIGSLSRAPARGPSVVTSTLDAELQREVEQLLRAQAASLLSHQATALSALVVDNSSSEILAWVGSPDFFSVEHLGQNDGVLALRQPGSALKPFVYGLAMERLRMHRATLLADVERRFVTEHGEGFSPQNYDGRFRGPVLLGTALGSSLNLPTVSVAARLGVSTLLDFLRKCGFDSLTKSASHYGLALSLGDGEVSLLQLVSAYAALARGGEYRELVAVRQQLDPQGRVLVPQVTPGVRLLGAPASAMLADILSDERARAEGFGHHGVLELPFSAAVKTGTSQAHRDNWAVGFTREFTVGVWVGNFDGSPMLRGTSGVVGAAPLTSEILQLAMRGRSPAPLVAPGALVPVTVCAESGGLPTPDCSARINLSVAPGYEPHGSCPFHGRVSIDPSDQTLAGPGCPRAQREVRGRYPQELAAWAQQAGRPLIPQQSSKRCPPVATEGLGYFRLERPRNGARYVIHPERSADSQALVTAVQSSGELPSIEWWLDGQLVGRTVPPHELRLPLRAGEHRLEARSPLAPPVRSSFTVETIP